MLGEMLATTGAPETCKFKISVRSQGQSKNEAMKHKIKIAVGTFIEEASYCGLNTSKGGRLPNARRVLSPSAFASILKPLSTVVTARRLPSLLNLKRGRAWHNVKWLD